MGLVVEQHVARVVHQGGAAVEHMGPALVIFAHGVLGVPPLGQAVIASVDGQYRGCNALVNGKGLIEPLDLGAGDLVDGVTQNLSAALCMGAEFDLCVGALSIAQEGAFTRRKRLDQSNFLPALNIRGCAQNEVGDRPVRPIVALIAKANWRYGSRATRMTNFNGSVD